MRWPWQPRKQTAEERRQAEARAEQVHREVVRPLREMRARDHLSDAIVNDIARRFQEGRQ
jgi:hypothetical protein